MIGDHLRPRSSSSVAPSGVSLRASVPRVAPPRHRAHRAEAQIFIRTSRKRSTRVFHPQPRALRSRARARFHRQSTAHVAPQRDTHAPTRNARSLAPRSHAHPTETSRHSSRARRSHSSASEPTDARASRTRVFARVCVFEQRPSSRVCASHLLYAIRHHARCVIIIRRAHLLVYACEFFARRY